jgi:anti-sigma regulatory factor (Ser/Thr protein kinase)
VNADLSLHIKNDIKEVSGLMAQVEAVLAEKRVSDRAMYKVNLVLEEILTNIIKYAYQDDRPHEIFVQIHVDENAIRIHVQDDGTEFDPQKIPEPDLELPIEEMKVGGLGLHLIRANVETIDYERKGTRNHLTVRLS